MQLSLAKMIDIPPVWLAGFVFVVWVQSAFLPLGPSPNGLVYALGTGLVAGGIVLIVLAAFEFKKHRTTIIPHLKPSHIVTSGVFSLSRNPIYLADAMILFGLSLRWQGYVGIALTPVFMILIARRFILAEENRLRVEFRAAFDAYAEQTRRWI